MQADWTDAITRARRHSPFLALAMEKLPEITALLATGKGEEALAVARQAELGEDARLALRRERLATALALAIGDLAGAFDLARVMQTLSSFADRALDRAIAAAIHMRVEDAEPAGFAAIALGKHGARELNYSSDIDPILLYDPERLPRRERDEPGEAAQRYARSVVELLSARDAEGYVFRVDLRLRPASEVSPLAVPVAGAISHYESSALAWERAAFIRARAAAGDIALGKDFLDHIRPFVWRRNLDFTALEEIRRLTGRIRKAYDGPLVPGPGFDLKRGRGGIREVEFFAQTHQLIFGGRDPSLRLGGTRSALDALAAAQIISTDDAQLLGEAYDRLRVIEHRLQMVDDRQTHKLPEAPEALDNVARLDGLEDGAALVAELSGLCEEVAQRYDHLLGQDSSPQAPAGTGVSQVPAEFSRRAREWKASMRVLKGSEARAAFDAIAPELHRALERAPDPVRAMARWQTLLERLPTAINLLRLFEQRPGLLEQVLRILTLAPPLADELARRPELLDALIDSTAFDLPGSLGLLTARMAPVEEAADLETRLDRIRQVVGEERFALGVQLIEARHDPLAIAAGLSRVAEAALQTGAQAAIDEFATRHGRVPDSELLVLGLGRLGGGALTHSSDLDLVYLFDGEIGVESDGPRPLTASLYYNRLAARVTAALSVPTAEGALYEVDTRLRPQGNQGPLAVSHESYARYQQDQAWTWEHKALTRARPLFGSAPARARLNGIVRAVLEAPRDTDRLQSDVLEMRAEISRHKPASGPLDVKLLRGGLVDCEFIVHFLQLRDGIALDPSLDRAIAGLIAAGRLPQTFADHHAELTRLLVAARLLAPDGEPSAPAAGIALAKACGSIDYPAMLHNLQAVRQGIAAQWAEHFGEVLEIDQ